MSQCRRIFIVGHPGAGKALLAKTVAEKLNWQFIDIDLGLEFQIGRTLAEILGQEGTDSFHRCQAEILKTQIAKEHIIVATDASVFDIEGNRELLSSEFVVFLQVSTQVQVERVARSPKPLLPVADLAAFFELLHTQRDALFNDMADVILNSDDNALEKHVANLINAVTTLKTDTTSVLKLDEKDLTVFHKTSHTPVNLSEQQAVTLKLLAQGKSSKEIARQMNISYRTVEGMLAKVMELTGCTSSKELIVLYHQHP